MTLQMSFSSSKQLQGFRALNGKHKAARHNDADKERAGLRSQSTNQSLQISALME